MAQFLGYWKAALIAGWIKFGASNLYEAMYEVRQEIENRRAGGESLPAVASDEW